MIKKLLTQQTKAIGTTQLIKKVDHDYKRLADVTVRLSRAKQRASQFNKDLSEIIKQLEAKNMVIFGGTVYFVHPKMGRVIERDVDVPANSQDGLGDGSVGNGSTTRSCMLVGVNDADAVLWTLSDSVEFKVVNEALSVLLGIDIQTNEQSPHTSREITPIKCKQGVDLSDNKTNVVTTKTHTIMIFRDFGNGINTDSPILKALEAAATFSTRDGDAVFDPFYIKSTESDVEFLLTLRNNMVVMLASISLYVFGPPEKGAKEIDVRQYDNRTKMLGREPLQGLLPQEKSLKELLSITRYFIREGTLKSISDLVYFPKLLDESRVALRTIQWVERTLSAIEQILTRTSQATDLWKEQLDSRS